MRLSDLMPSPEMFLYDLTNANMEIDAHAAVIPQNQSLIERTTSLVNDSITYLQHMNSSEQAQHAQQFNNVICQIAIKLFRTNNHVGLNVYALNILLSEIVFPLGQMSHQEINLLDFRVINLIILINQPSTNTVSRIVQRCQSSQSGNQDILTSIYIYRLLIQYFLTKLKNENTQQSIENIKNFLSQLDILMSYELFQSLANTLNPQLPAFPCLTHETMLALFNADDQPNTSFSIAVRLLSIMSPESELLPLYIHMNQFLTDPIALFNLDFYQALKNIITETTIFDISFSALPSLSYDILHRLELIHITDGDENLTVFFHILNLIKQSPDDFTLNYNLNLTTRSTLFRYASVIYATNHFNEKPQLTSRILIELESRFRTMSIHEAIVYARVVVIQIHPLPLIDIVYSHLMRLLTELPPHEIIAHISHLETAGVPNQFLQECYSIFHEKNRLLALEAAPTPLEITETPGPDSPNSSVHSAPDIGSAGVNVRAELELMSAMLHNPTVVVVFKKRPNLKFDSISDVLKKHDELVPFLCVKPSHIIEQNLKKHGIQAPEGLLPNGLYIRNTRNTDLIIQNGIIFFMGEKTYLTDELAQNASIRPHLKPCGNHFAITNGMRIIRHHPSTEFGAYEANHIKHNDVIEGTLTIRTSPRGDILNEFALLALPPVLIIPPFSQYEVAWDYGEHPGGSNNLTSEMLSASANDIPLITPLNDQPEDANHHQRAAAAGPGLFPIPQEESLTDSTLTANCVLN